MHEVIVDQKAVLHTTIESLLNIVNITGYTFVHNQLNAGQEF